VQTSPVSSSPVVLAPPPLHSRRIRGDRQWPSAAADLFCAGCCGKATPSGPARRAEPARVAGEGLMMWRARPGRASALRSPGALSARSARPGSHLSPGSTGCGKSPPSCPGELSFIRRLAIVRGDLAKKPWWPDRLPGAWPTGRHVLKPRHSAQSSRISARAHHVSSLRRTLPRQSKVERTYHGDRPTDATDPTLTLARGRILTVGE
jgi:hypothetical protein